ncbi:MAG TPA: NAD(P)-binding domain-containing protein, partial [Thermodesulfobacteriota bacterium]|nr:NAD(P)-binding domain-containing protein [Thermodesulfobacteriota bacterium]
MKDIAIVGLGLMGTAISLRLIEAGYKVTGWNRNRDKSAPLVALGMREAATPCEAACGADIVFSSVTNAQAVRAVALGEDGIIAGLPKDSIYLDMSTIGPDSSREIAQAFAAAGLTMLDAP